MKINDSPWKNVPVLPPKEQEAWELFRDMVAIQLRIDHIGEHYPNYKEPGQDFRVSGQHDMIDFLVDILGQK